MVDKHLFRYYVFISISSIVGSLLIAMMLGACPLSFREVWISLKSWALNEPETKASTVKYLLFNIRLPRILVAMWVGAGLALAGGAIQSVFRNPLADPGLIGVSSGAMLAAVCYLVLKPYLPEEFVLYGDFIALAFFAFLGGVSAVFIVYKLSTQNGYTNIGTMLLAGIAIAALAGGITGLMIFYSDESQLRDITFWTMGSLAIADWGEVGFMILLITFSGIQILRQCQSLEVMMLGEQEARYLGVDVQRIKNTVIVYVALIIAGSVAFTGMIGFVGLVVPHVVRLFAKRLKFMEKMILMPLVGALLLLWADTAARTVLAPAELPVGILMSLLGAPFFLWLLLKQRV